MLSPCILHLLVQFILFIRLLTILEEPVIIATCVRRSGPTKTHTDAHHRAMWRSVMTAATAIVDCPDHFNTDMQNHNTNHGGTAVFGLPKYRSCALLSTKDSTHNTMQVSVLCKRISNKTYRLFK